MDVSGQQLLLLPQQQMLPQVALAPAGLHLPVPLNAAAAPLQYMPASLQLSVAVVPVINGFTGGSSSSGVMVAASAADALKQQLQQLQLKQLAMTQAVGMQAPNQPVGSFLMPSTAAAGEASLVGAGLDGLTASAAAAAGHASAEHLLNAPQNAAGVLSASACQQLQGRQCMPVWCLLLLLLLQQRQTALLAPTAAAMQAASSWQCHRVGLQCIIALRQQQCRQQRWLQQQQQFGHWEMAGDLRLTGDGWSVILVANSLLTM
jgi:hypothetical protein